MILSVCERNTPTSGNESTQSLFPSEASSSTVPFQGLYLSPALVPPLPSASMPDFSAAFTSTPNWPASGGPLAQVGGGAAVGLDGWMNTLLPTEDNGLQGLIYDDRQQPTPLLGPLVSYVSTLPIHYELSHRTL
jgi:hypothetical protein